MKELGRRGCGKHLCEQGQSAVLCIFDDGWCSLPCPLHAFLVRFFSVVSKRRAETHDHWNHTTFTKGPTFATWDPGSL